AAATQTLNDAKTSLAALRATGAGQARDITAPFAGIVTTIAATPGGALPAGTLLLRLAAGSGLSIVASLPEHDALRVRPGAQASLTLLNSNATMPAIVAQRAAMLDPQTGLINITLIPQGTPLLGEPVAARISAGSVTGYPVPRAAVLNDAQGDYVYQLDAKDIAHRVNVRVLDSEGDTSILAPGLDASMRLATTGAYQLSDGMSATLQGNPP
ncbi:MAG TPA: HlyD family efflux transporter periplasmic adaptor subunit, partial [Acidocella sp.]|nr:HlyD family efflux transporter periplasmic adaptor subunit [Acidocella sp.]